MEPPAHCCIEHHKGGGRAPEQRRGELATLPIMRPPPRLFSLGAVGKASRLPLPLGGRGRAAPCPLVAGGLCGPAVSLSGVTRPRWCCGARGPPGAAP